MKSQHVLLTYSDYEPCFPTQAASHAFHSPSLFPVRSSICFTFVSRELDRFYTILTVSCCENEKNEHVFVLIGSLQMQNQRKKKEVTRPFQYIYMYFHWLSHGCPLVRLIWFVDWSRGRWTNNVLG